MLAALKRRSSLPNRKVIAMRFYLFALLSLLAVSTGCVTAPKTAPAALCTTDSECSALCERMGGKDCEHP